MHCVRGTGNDGGARWRQVRLQETVRPSARTARRGSAGVGRRASLENVSIAATFTTPLSATPCCTAQLRTPDDTRNGTEARSQPAIGHRRPLDGRARLLDERAAGEGDCRREHGDAQHAGAWQRYLQRDLTAELLTVCPAQPPGDAQARHRQPGRQVQGQGRGPAHIRQLPHVVSAQVHPAVRTAPLGAATRPSDRPLGSPSGRTSSPSTSPQVVSSLSSTSSSTTRPPSTPRSPTSPPSTTPPRTSASRLSTTCSPSDTTRA